MDHQPHGTRGSTSSGLTGSWPPTAPGISRWRRYARKYAVFIDNDVIVSPGRCRCGRRPPRRSSSGKRVGAPFGEPVTLQEMCDGPENLSKSLIHLAKY